jgi:branched-chain amino acid aminotransferase
MRVAWLDGALVEPRAAALSIDDPGVRWGEGLFETMRAEAGRVALLERHLARLRASADALGLAPMPDAGRMRAAVDEALAAFGPRRARVRLIATPRPTLLVEVAPLDAGPATARARSLRGAWLPDDRLAEHKSLSYARHRLSQRRAEAAGADHALLLDARGRLGEAALASVFCAVGGDLVTAPATGLLPGVARAVVLEALGGRQRALDEDAWRAADEIVLTNAVRGAVAVVEVDGRPVGAGVPGPRAAGIAGALRAAGLPSP